ncbi:MULTISPECIES: hypothetical protein [unclassified Mycolicibacterium]|uniref:hypothetical protein n=1 Tax=unclassified Mycolicibacterium TaxID=2636767 RepID=UPI0012DEA353|nr:MULTISPECIES: hypothetical protein [unclassified Mycolicibacterium]MUL61086.1 hypothetical protein [Mycolicibacterium sp. CBMA 335]
MLDLLEELHPQRPPVRERDHTTRLEAVRDALHAEIVEGVTDAVRCGDELNPRLLDYVGAWSGTYRGAALMPAAWSPLARPPVKKLTYMTFESPRPPDSPD